MKTQTLLLISTIIVALVSCTQGQKTKTPYVHKKKMVNLLVCSEKGGYIEVVQQVPFDSIPYHKGQELVIAQPSKQVPDYWEIPNSDTEYLQYRKCKIDTIQFVYFE